MAVAVEEERSIHGHGEENIQQVEAEVGSEQEEARAEENCEPQHGQGAAWNFWNRAKDERRHIPNQRHWWTRQESAGKAMRLEDVKNAYETLSGIASQIVRQLSLAGIGLIWLFNVGTGIKPALPHALLQGALFIFLALFFDLLQYLVGTFTWFVYFRNKERAGTPPEEEFLAPAWINWPTWALFCVKAACMLIAYLGFIFPFLFTTFAAAS